MSDSNHKTIQYSVYAVFKVKIVLCKAEIVLCESG